MTEFTFNRARSVAVTGHRVLGKDINKQRLDEIFRKLVDSGVNVFYIGMALGFDTMCFQVLEKIREEKDIKLVACIPCPSQPMRFNFEQKREYERMVKSADIKVIISNEYTPTCMQKRNEYMVDRAGILISYLRRDYGGTKNTVDYAKKVGVTIYNV